MQILPYSYQKILFSLFTTLLLAGFLLPSQGCCQVQAEQNGSAQALETIEPVKPAEPILSVLVPSEVFNGQAFLIKITSPRLEQVNLNWAGKALNVTPLATDSGLFEAMALLPVDLDTEPQVRELEFTIHDAGKEINESIFVQISKKKYPEQQLTVDPKFVHLSDADQKRHQEERVRVNKVLAVYGPERHWELPFIRPVPGIVTSLFGVARMFNGVPRSSHKGLDLRGATGTPIKACAAGKVVLADDLFFSGNVVYLDHGLGVFTMYCHMSEIIAKEGDFVRAGDVIGKVGATGRVTGPHLHLSAFVMGTSVDPEVLLNMAADAEAFEPKSPNNAMPAVSNSTAN